VDDKVQEKSARGASRASFEEGCDEDPICHLVSLLSQ